MKVLSPEAHGVLDYVTAASLLVVPEVLEVSKDSERASWLLRISGIAILAQALLTNYKLGLVRLLPFKMHLGNDFVLSSGLALAPFLLGIRDERRPKTWLPHLLFGLYAFATTLMTDSRSRRDD